MTQNLIAAYLPEEVSSMVKQNLLDAKTNLFFLLSTLQSEDVSTLFKPGNTYLPFIEKAHQTMLDHPEILPQVFNKEAFSLDFTLLNELRPILTQINELAESIQKTFMAVGSDTLVASLEVYSAVKQNKDKVPGLAYTADEMAVFFKKSRQKAIPVV